MLSESTNVAVPSRIQVKHGPHQLNPQGHTPPKIWLIHRQVGIAHSASALSSGQSRSSGRRSFQASQTLT